MKACQGAGTVEDLMTPKPVAVGPEATVGEVWRTMAERRFRHMPVVTADGRLAGILSQRDLVVGASTPDALPGAGDARPVSELMHRSIDTVRPDSCVAEAARHMLRHKRSCLPVVDEGYRLVGILTEADYLRLATRGAPPCSCGGVEAAGG
jgi:CBS domain-containing protein